MFEDDANCIWLCEHSDFYLSFLNNETFLKYYLKFLDDYATGSFFNKIKVFMISDLNTLIMNFIQD